jgi:hypothetical protein
LALLIDDHFIEVLEGAVLYVMMNDRHDEFLVCFALLGEGTIRKNGN